MKSYSWRKAAPLTVFLVSSVVAVYGSNSIKELSRVPVNEGISHVMPAPVNLILAAGDRYLAADLLMFRVIISVGEGVVHFKDRAQLQMQAAVFNPFFEDNYYQASASLPWEGFVKEGQFVLQRASDARVDDPWPSFFYGFSEYYFLQDFSAAAEHVLVSAERSNGTNRRLFKDVAAKWLSKGANYQLALGMVIELKKNTESPVTKKLLQRRAFRLQNLILLEEAMEIYEKKYDKKLQSIELLLIKNLIFSVPVDPWGAEYVIESGRIVVKGYSHVR